MFGRKRFMNLHRLDTCRAERVVESGESPNIRACKTTYRQYTV